MANQLVLTPRLAVIQALHQSYGGCLTLVEKLVLGDRKLEEVWPSLSGGAADPTNEFHKARAFMDMVRLEIAVKEEVLQMRGRMTAEDLVQMALGTTNLIPEIIPDLPDFVPSRFFMSLHAELFDAYEVGRPINWSSIHRQDPRIATSTWLTDSPEYREWWDRDGARTPVPQTLQTPAPTNSNPRTSFIPPPTITPAAQPPQLPVPKPLPPSDDPMDVDQANSKQKRERRKTTAYKSKKYVEITDEELVKEEPADDALANTASVRPLYKPTRRPQTHYTPKPPPPIMHGGILPPVGHPMRKELLTCDACRQRNIVRAAEDEDLPAGKKRPVFECEVPDVGTCSNCRQWKTRCSRVPVGWGRKRRELTEEAELQWKISGVEPALPEVNVPRPPRSRGRQRPVSSGNRRRHPSLKPDSSAASSDAEKVVEKVVTRGKGEVEKGKGKERERERKRERSEIAANDGDEDGDERSTKQKPAKRQRHLSPPPIARQRRRLSTPVAKQQHAEAGPSTRTRWIEKSDGTQGRKITVSRDPPPSPLDRMGARQDVVDARLSAVERAVAGTNDVQQEVLRALREMSDNLKRISIQAAPPMQSASDIQLNGYARRMHRIEAALQGLTAGLENNRQEVASVNRRLNDPRNDATPAGPAHTERSATGPMEIDLDTILHAEAMDDGRGTHPAPHWPVIGDRVNQAIQVDLEPTPFHIIVTNASPPRSFSSATSVEHGVVEAGLLTPEVSETALPSAELSPPDTVSVLGPIGGEAPVNQAIAVPNAPTPDSSSASDAPAHAPFPLGKPELPEVAMPAERTPATIEQDVPPPDSIATFPAEVDLQVPSSRPAIDTSIPPWGDPMSPLSLFGTQESQPPRAETTADKSAGSRSKTRNEQILRRSPRVTAKSRLV